MNRVVYILILLCAAETFANSRATMLFLTSPQSPEAIGRGGLYFSPDDADPFSVFSRPGQVGLLAQAHRGLAAFYPQRTIWMPGIFSSLDIKYSARAIFYGFDSRFLAKHFGESAPISVAVGYSEVNLDLGETTSVDENGHVIGTSQSRENAKGLTFSIGLHHECWKLGVGFTHKYLKSDLGIYHADGFATDAGISCYWDVATAMRKAGSGHTERTVRPLLLFGANYSMTNIGGAVRYSNVDNSEGNPLPRNGLLGFNMLTGFETQLVNGAWIRVLSVGAGVQGEDELIASDLSGHYHYTNPVGEIHPVRQFLQGKSDPEVTLREGWEFSIFETAFFRRGEVRGGDYLQSYRTEGFGFSAAGALKLLCCSPLKQFDIQYHQSTISWIDPPDEWRAVDNDMTYRQVTLSWSY